VESPRISAAFAWWTFRWNRRRAQFDPEPILAAADLLADRLGSLFAAHVQEHLAG
jgi:hypothetical protein